VWNKTEAQVWAWFVSGLGLCSQLLLGRAVSIEAFDWFKSFRSSRASVTINQGQKADTKQELRLWQWTLLHK